MPKKTLLANFGNLFLAFHLKLITLFYVPGEHPCKEPLQGNSKLK